MVRAIILHKCHSIPLDINPSVGILYFACCVLLAYWEIHHARGRLLDFSFSFFFFFSTIAFISYN